MQNNTQNNTTMRAKIDAVLCHLNQVSEEVNEHEEAAQAAMGNAVIPLHNYANLIRLGIFTEYTIVKQFYINCMDAAMYDLSLCDDDRAAKTCIILNNAKKAMTYLGDNLYTDGIGISAKFEEFLKQVDITDPNIQK